MEQASSKEQVRALVIPGRSRTRVLVGRGSLVLGRFSMNGAPAVVVPELLEMVGGSFDLAAVLVDVGGFQRVVMEAPAVVEVCALLGVDLVALAPASTVSP